MKITRDCIYRIPHILEGEPLTNVIDDLDDQSNIRYAVGYMRLILVNEGLINPTMLPMPALESTLTQFTVGMRSTAGNYCWLAKSLKSIAFSGLCNIDSVKWTYCLGWDTS